MIKVQDKKLISVIMSNFNTPEEYLRSAVESILNQTYECFEFIIIDDCSTDNSLSVIELYKDGRIVLIKNEKNLGITKSLNRGLAVAKGEYVARMDADDIAFPERFEKQIAFLEAHPEYIVCGAGVELIGEWEKKHSNKYICRTIPDREQFRIDLLFGNYPNIVHPTTMFNHTLLKKHGITYNEEYPLAQDYRMWVSCSEVAECTNLPETLLYYRVHGQAVSNDKKELQKSIALQIMREQLAKLDLELSDEYSEIHRDFLSTRKPYDLKIRAWIKTIIKHNIIHKVYNQKKLEKTLWNKWAETVYFELFKAKGFGKIKALFTLPVRYYPELLKIKKQRSLKEN